MAGAGLLLSEGRLGEPELLGQVGDAPLLDAHVPGGGVEPGLGVAELLVGFV
jgi:hypothetical protein